MSYSIQKPMKNNFDTGKAVWGSVNLKTTPKQTTTRNCFGGNGLALMQIFSLLCRAS